MQNLLPFVVRFIGNINI